MFDEQWYVGQYPDVLLCAMSPAEHFVRIGLRLGRKPSEGGNIAEASSFLVACRTLDSAGILSNQQRDAVDISRLFDAAWYRARYAAGLAPDVDLLSDYLTRAAGNPRIDPGPLFSTAYYAENNPDSSGMAPLLHACVYGLREGRPVLDPRNIDNFLTEHSNAARSPLGELLDPSRPVSILHWSDGNFFFSEIAAYLTEFLRPLGFDAQCSADLSPPSLAKHNIVIVAPHEFCVHGPGRNWDEQSLKRAIYLNTEQWHTGWFSHAYRYLLRSNKAIDMNPASAAGLQALGIRTAFLPLLPRSGTPFGIGDAPLSREFADNRFIHKLTYPADLSERSYDVLFVGAANARREGALASLAPVLADHESFIHCPRFAGPVRPGDPNRLSTPDLVQIARNAKILLNIHQGESRYFEWHRLFLFGIMEGCIVLTESCIPNGFVEAGTHYLECDLNSMPNRLRWLLETTEGEAEMQRVRANCDRLRQDARARDWLAA